MRRRKGNERDRDVDTDSVYEEEGHVVEEIFDDFSLENEMAGTQGRERGAEHKDASFV